MAALPLQKLTAEQYLAMERASETRHAFLDGEVFALSGATRPHNLITLAIASSFRTQLRGKRCEAYAADMRVHVPATGLYTYPDVAVACGEPSFLDDELDTLLDPVVIVEVLSKSTEAYDRGLKLVHYRSIPSLRETVLVAQDRVYVEHSVRQEDDRWLLTELRDPDREIGLNSIGCKLTLAEVYEGVPGIETN